MSKSPKGLQSSSGVKKKTTKRQNLKSRVWEMPSHCVQRVWFSFLCKGGSYMTQSVGTCWHMGEGFKAALLELTHSWWTMGEDIHSPVGLCRMKNRKGLSTINQGGDDLAIRIAAAGGKGKPIVHPAWGRPRQRVIQGRTSFLSQGLAVEQQALGSALTAQPPWARPVPIRLI